MGPTNKPKATC